MDLVGVAPEAVHATWLRVAPWITAACERPGCDQTADGLRILCAAGVGQLVVVLNEASRPVAAGVTQVRDYRDRRSCWLLAIGGTGARAWRSTLKQIEAGARRNGCGAVEFVGRRGWARLLPDYRAAPCEAGLHYVKELR